MRLCLQIKVQCINRNYLIRLQAVNNEKPDAEPQSIFLEGSLPHDSQILVADSETKTETVFDDELDDSKEEPAVSKAFIAILLFIEGLRCLEIFEVLSTFLVKYYTIASPTLPLLYILSE